MYGIMELRHYGTMVKTTLILTDEIYEKLRREAFEKKTSMSKIACNYFGKESPVGKQAASLTKLNIAAERSTQKKKVVVETQKLNPSLNRPRGTIDPNDYL